MPFELFWELLLHSGLNLIQNCNSVYIINVTNRLSGRQTKIDTHTSPAIDKIDRTKSEKVAPTPTGCC